MFWREREREIRDNNGGPPIGTVRVLVVGDSGVGKTSLVHLILNGSAVARPPQTIGCAVSVKHITYRSSASSSNGLEGDVDRDFFVELWDVCGHERYKDCRSLFYSQVNGVIFVYDISQKRTKSSLQKWAAEVTANGTFSAPLASGGPYGLPVPYIVISNKADITAKESERGSSGNLVDVARQWVEKQGLLSSSEDLPMTASFPGNAAHIAAAKEGRFDNESPRFFTPPRDLCGSQRFFFTSSSSSSLVEEARISGQGGPSSSSEDEESPLTPKRDTQTHPQNYIKDGTSAIPGGIEDCIALLTVSPSPYEDFRKSMQQVLDAKVNNQERVDWDFMEELLFCYLRLNEKKQYRYILSAFVDLIVVLRQNSSIRGPEGSRN